MTCACWAPRRSRLRLQPRDRLAHSLIRRAQSPRNRRRRQPKFPKLKRTAGDHLVEGRVGALRKGDLKRQLPRSSNCLRSCPPVRAQAPDLRVRGLCRSCARNYGRTDTTLCVVAQAVPGLTNCQNLISMCCASYSPVDDWSNLASTAGTVGERPTTLSLTQVRRIVVSEARSSARRLRPMPALRAMSCKQSSGPPPRRRQPCKGRGARMNSGHCAVLQCLAGVVLGTAI